MLATVFVLGLFRYDDYMVTEYWTNAKRSAICWSTVPVYELVFLQILAALSDVSGYIEKIHHGQAGWVLLIKEIRDIVH